MATAEKKGKGKPDKVKKLYLKAIKNMVVDIGCSGYFPTLTRTRCQAFAYWICRKGKTISLSEIMRAFALPDGLAVKYIQSAKDKGVKENKLAAMLGNSVAYSVSNALMKQAIGMLLVK